MKKYYWLICLLSCLVAIRGTAQYRQLLNFNYFVSGSLPEGGLTIVGNKLFGMTNSGGPTGEGVLFSINPDGTGYNDVLDFNTLNGQWPDGSLTLSGSKLFGVTLFGGAYNSGCIFSIDTDGNNFKLLYSMADTGNNGEYPIGCLVISGKKLFGTTSGGVGVYSFGVVFSMDTDGTNYKMLTGFGGSGNNPNSLILSGSTLYGTTIWGGIYGQGDIYSIDTDGTNLHELHSFNDTNGGQPDGSLLLIGANLYGAASISGPLDTVNPLPNGAIFTIDTAGGLNYRVIHYFNDTLGSSPGGPLLYSMGKFYGLTASGGAHGSGILFSMDLNGADFNDKFDFTTSTGSVPLGALTLLGGNVYGMTSIGGPTDDGVIFSFDTVGCNNGYNEPICVVTIDTATNKPEIIWGRTNSPPAGGYGTYNIYKDTTAGFWVIDRQPLDSLSEYIDGTSSFDGPISYELSTSDSCGESALSAPHTTIYLTTASGINVYILNWTAYVGFTPTLYRIFRGPSMNALVQIDSVPSTVLTYHDTLPPAGSIYLVEAVSPFGVCVPTTHRPGHPSVSLSGSFSNGYNAGALVTGTNEVKGERGKVKVYPNPSNGEFTIQWSVVSPNGSLWDGQSADVQINIINELGQVVYSQNITAAKGTLGTTGTYTEQMNLSTLASGIYTLRMESNSGITVKKLEIMQR